jgi:hypothetical protein
LLELLQIDFHPVLLAELLQLLPGLLDRLLRLLRELAHLRIFRLLSGQLTEGKPQFRMTFSLLHKVASFRLLSALGAGGFIDLLLAALLLLFASLLLRALLLLFACLLLLRGALLLLRLLLLALLLELLLLWRLLLARLSSGGFLDLAGGLYLGLELLGLLQMLPHFSHLLPGKLLHLLVAMLARNPFQILQVFASLLGDVIQVGLVELRTARLNQLLELPRIHRDALLLGHLLQHLVRLLMLLAHLLAELAHLRILRFLLRQLPQHDLQLVLDRALLDELLRVGYVALRARWLINPLAGLNLLLLLWLPGFLALLPLLPLLFLLALRIVGNRRTHGQVRGNERGNGLQCFGSHVFFSLVFLAEIRDRVSRSSLAPNLCQTPVPAIRVPPFFGRGGLEDTPPALGRI